MRYITDKLLECRLFNKMTPNEIEEFLNNSFASVVEYMKGQFIFAEKDEPKKIFIMLRGKVAICRNTSSGKKITITSIDKSGDIFGEIYIFIQKKEYDVYAEVREDCTILEIANDIFTKTSKSVCDFNKVITYNLMCIFASKAFFMKSRINILSSYTIREKVSKLIYEQQNIRGIMEGILNREQMAEYLCVTRPSLSRELSSMQSEGIIEIKGRSIRVVDKEKLESYL